jgi:hypothetical protein
MSEKAFLNIGYPMAVRLLYLMVLDFNPMGILEIDAVMPFQNLFSDKV